MKRFFLIAIQLILIVIIIFYFNYGSNKNKERKINTNAQIIQALNLTLINTDTVYQNYDCRIYNDTIVGYYYSKKSRNQAESKLFYFKQNLKNLIKRLVIPNKSIKPVRIDVLKDGCIYFGEFGRSNVQRVCANGNVEELFKDNHLVFYANKIMMYKDRTIIIGMNGIFIFNTQTQQLLFKYNFINVTELASGSVIGHQFIFTEMPNYNYKSSTLVHSIDLDNLDFSWHKEFKNEYLEGISNNFRYVEFMPIKHDDKNVFIRTSNKLYLIGLRNGNINYENCTLKSIISDGNRQFIATTNNSIVRLNIQYKSIWEIKNLKLIGIHGLYVIATTNDKQYYVIINKNNGIIEKRIAINKGEMNLDLIDKYVLLGGISLYK